MKIDLEYVAELKLLDKKEAKDGLTEYAKEYFNVELKKSKSFDNMIIQLEEFISNYKEEDIPHGEGFSTSDLLDAVDHLDGKDIFNEADQSVVDKIRDIVSVGPIVIDEPLPELPPETMTVIDVNVDTGTTLVETNVSLGKYDTLLEAAKHIQESENLPRTQESETAAEEYDLTGFSPHLYMMGHHPGYAHLPYWIYDWILENPDWKKNPEKCKHWEAHQTLKSLLYYIRRDGQVRIRESRNSRFHVLK